MAFAKPVVVVGEKGFARVFSPDSAKAFYQNGMYGIGDGISDECQLASALNMLTEDGFDREALGKFSRDFVVQHHSLDVVGATLADIYQSASNDNPSRLATTSDALRMMYMYLRERRFDWPSRDHLDRKQPAERVL
jgi:hypothetical protein